MSRLTNTLQASVAVESAKKRRRESSCTIILGPKQDYTDALRAALLDHTWPYQHNPRRLETYLEVVHVIADEKQAIATPVSRREHIEIGDDNGRDAIGDFTLKQFHDQELGDGSHLTSYRVES